MDTLKYPHTYTYPHTYIIISLFLSIILFIIFQLYYILAEKLKKCITFTVFGRHSYPSGLHLPHSDKKRKGSDTTRKTRKYLYTKKSNLAA